MAKYLTDTVFTGKVSVGGVQNNEAALNVITSNGSIGSINFETGAEVTGIINCATELMEFRVGDGVGMSSAKQLKIDAAGIEVTGSIDVSGTSGLGGNVTIGGTTGSGGNALAVNRGSDGAQALRIQNSGEVVVANNYFYATGAGVSMYVQNQAVFRGSIVNDSGDLTIADNLSVSGSIAVTGTVDGRDVASDGSKLDGISSNARTGTVTSVSASTGTNAKGLSVSSGTTTPVVGLDIVNMTSFTGDFNDGSIDYNNVFVPMCDDDDGNGNTKTTITALRSGIKPASSQFVLNSNFSDDTSTTSFIYFPFNSLTDGTSSQYYRHWAAPCTGRIKRVVMQHTSGSMSSGFTTQLQVYKGSSTFATSSELTVSTTSDGGYIEYNPSGSDIGKVSFVKGDRIRIRFSKSATGKYWRGVAASIIIELDQV
jgi:hypothetical protein